MPSKATVSITGHLARDPELRQSQNGNDYCRLTVPVGKREEPSIWFTATIFGVPATWAAKWGKGDLVRVDGELTMNEWTTKEGEVRQDLQVMYASAQLLKSKGGGSGRKSDDGDSGDLPF